MEKKSIIVSGGIGSATSCIGGGFAIWAPDMIVPPVWGVVLMCLGIVIALATVVYAFWPSENEGASMSALPPGSQLPDQKPRIDVAHLEEGNFDNVTDTSDRTFLKSKKAGKITITQSRFGSDDA